MKYVIAEFTDSGTYSNPRAYLEQLPTLAPSLPGGARAFATDPEHYNYAGNRCVKDLKPQRLTSGQTNGSSWLVLELKHNCWKHEDDLTIRYIGVQGLTMTPPGEAADIAGLGAVMLDWAADRAADDRAASAPGEHRTGNQRHARAGRAGRQALFLHSAGLRRRR